MTLKVLLYSYLPHNFMSVYNRAVNSSGLSGVSPRCTTWVSYTSTKGVERIISLP